MKIARPSLAGELGHLQEHWDRAAGELKMLSSNWMSLTLDFTPALLSSTVFTDIAMLNHKIGMGKCSP